MEEGPEFFGVNRLMAREDLGKEFTQNLAIRTRSEEVACLVSSSPVPPFANRLNPARQSVRFRLKNQTRSTLAGFHPLSQSAKGPRLGRMRNTPIRLHRLKHALRRSLIGSHGNNRIQHARANQHRGEIEGLGPCGRGGVARKIRPAATEPQSHGSANRISPPAAQGIRRRIGRIPGVVIHRTEAAQRTPGHHTKARMPDFTPLTAQFVSRRGKARRPPRPLDNGKGEKLCPRKNPGIARIQPGVQRQIGKGRRRNRQNLVIRQSAPDFRDR